MAVLTSPAVSQLLIEARTLLNQPVASNSFWGDPELIGYLNDGIANYFLEINERAEGQFDKLTTLSLVSGQETVSLPSDFFQVRKLSVLANNKHIVCPYFNDETVSVDAQPTSSGTEAYAPYYFFRGNSLVLRPIPGFSQADALRLEYTAMPDTLVVGGDALTSWISPVYKEVVVLHAVYKAKMKEDMVNGSNTAEKATALLADAYTKFKETLGKRSKYPTYIIPFTP